MLGIINKTTVVRSRYSGCSIKTHLCVVSCILLLYSQPGLTEENTTKQEDTVTKSEVSDTNTSPITAEIAPDNSPPEIATSESSEIATSESSEIDNSASSEIETKVVDETDKEKEKNAEPSNLTDSESKEKIDDSAVAKETDPLLAACKNAKPGEEITVEGTNIVCKGEGESGKVFDFKAATPIEEPTNGYVGFSDKYLNDFYLTTGFGYANYASMVSYSDLDFIKQLFLDEGYNEANFTGLPHGFDGSISLGYIANKFILIELGYSYLGTVTINGEVSDDTDSFTYTKMGTMSSLDISTIARYKLNDLVLLPITNTIHLMAILEAHQWKRETTVTYLATDTTGISSGFGFGLGLGADFQINEFLTARSAWKYKTISNEGISTVMFSLVMKNNTRYAQAIQNSIVNPIMGIFK